MGAPAESALYKRVLVAIASTLPLIACAGFEALTYRFPAYEGKDAACITGNSANAIRFHTTGESRTRLKVIDETPILLVHDAPLGGIGPYCIKPGLHKVLVVADHGPDTTENFVNVELGPGRNYSLRANLQGITFVFQLVDISADPEVKINEFRIKAGAAAHSSAAVPVFISPVR